MSNVINIKNNYKVGLIGKITVVGLLSSHTVTGVDPDGIAIVPIAIIESGSCKWVFNNLTKIGTYTITATDGTKTVNKDVLFDIIGQYEVRMSIAYQTYVYNGENGSAQANRCIDVSGDYHIIYGWNYLSSSGYKFDETSSYMDIGDNSTSTYTGIGIQTNNAIDVTNFSKFCIEAYSTSHSTGSYGWGYSFYLASNIISSLHLDRGIPAGGGQGDIHETSRAVTEVDISEITGSYHIMWECSAGALSSHTNLARIYKVWLE